MIFLYQCEKGSTDRPFLYSSGETGWLHCDDRLLLEDALGRNYIVEERVRQGRDAGYALTNFSILVQAALDFWKLSEQDVGHVLEWCYLASEKSCRQSC